MNAIEDSGDIDLDALLEDLCMMERDLRSGGSDETSTSKEAQPSFPPSKRLSSPVKVVFGLDENK